MPPLFPKLNSPGRRKRTAAFSLIEIVVAIGIVAFCLLTTIGLLGNGFSAANDANSRTTMAAIAARTLAVVAQELKAGNSPTDSLADYTEFFDVEGLPLPAEADTSQWAYQSSLSFSPLFAGSSNENKFLLRADARIQSRYETKNIYQYFASNTEQAAPAGP